MAGFDKSWMKLKNRTYPKYEKGVDQFLDFAFDNERISFRHGQNHEFILCPCRNCVNGVKMSRHDAEIHLKVDGIWMGYTNWVCHGETPLSDGAFDIPSIGMIKVEDHIDTTVEMLQELQEAERVRVEEEVFISVIGKDRPGRVRCAGSVETLSIWYGSTGASSSAQQKLMEDRLKEQEDRLKLQEEQMDQMRAKFSKMDQMQAKLSEMDQMQVKLSEMDQMRTQMQQMNALLNQLHASKAHGGEVGSSGAAEDSVTLRAASIHGSTARTSQLHLWRLRRGEHIEARGRDPVPGVWLSHSVQEAHPQDCPV